MKNMGYLFNFDGHGVFSPAGKVNITPEEMEAHNKELSEAEIKGLDENCQIGQGGTFYFVKGQVQTFVGTVVASSDFVWRSGQSIIFRRNGKRYRGRLKRDADCFNFKRFY